MGSPYMTIESKRVNVIKSERGFVQLLRSICHITNSYYLVDITTKFVVNTRLQGAKYHDEILAGCEVHEHSSKASQAFWVLINSSPAPWSNFSTTIVDLTDCYLRAIEDAARVSILIATRYEFSESRTLDRVVILDMTARSPLLK